MYVLKLQFGSLARTILNVILFDMCVLLIKAMTEGDSQAITKRLIEIIHDTDGITDSQLRIAINSETPLDDSRRLYMLQDLQKQGFLRVWKTPKGEIAYGYQDPEVGKKLDKVDANDKIVYQLVNESRARGLSKIDLKHKSGMNQKVLSASLKNLDKYGLIKNIKAKDKNRWMYFAYDQVPDADIVGGKFYEDGEINDTMIDTIRSKIVALIESKGKASQIEIIKYLVDSSEDTRDLREEEVQTLINTLIFDDVIEDVATIGKAEYAISKNNSDNILFSGFKSVPCFTCPVFFECKPGGNISPETCIYFEDW